MLFLLATQFFSVILLLIALISVLSNPDISVALPTLLNVMNSRNPFIFVPACCLSLFDFLSYLFFFIGWGLVVLGKVGFSPEELGKGSIFAFFYLLIYLLRVSVSFSALLGLASLAYIQELFVGSGLLFNLIEAILLSLALLYFAKAFASPAKVYDIKNTGMMYISGATFAGIGYVIFLSGLIFPFASSVFAVTGLVLIYLGFGIMITMLKKFNELWLAIENN